MRLAVYFFVSAVIILIVIIKAKNNRVLKVGTKRSASLFGTVYTGDSLQDRLASRIHWSENIRIHRTRPQQALFQFYNLLTDNLISFCSLCLKCLLPFISAFFLKCQIDEL